MNTITFSNITKRYDEQLAVDNFSLTIQPGQIYGLLGPNGAGKSTLINMLCGVTTIDKGDVSIGDLSVKKNAKACKKLIGYVPQEIAVFDDLSVKENLVFFANISGIKRSLHKERIEEALAIAKLEDFQKKKAQDLSGGMKRRLNIACAMMHHPEILIMDEPTVGIDPQSRNHILSLVKTINQERNTTIIYTSHYMEEVEAICDELTIVDEGRITISGSVNTIISTISNKTTMNIGVSPLTPSTLATLENLQGVSALSFRDGVLSLTHLEGDTSVASIFETLQANKVSIHNINTQKPNLEQVFLHLTGKQLRDGE